MGCRLIVWSTVAWIAVCVALYVYALNELIAWR
jgi:hypothetical protein